jgi:hypothetical protein
MPLQKGEISVPFGGGLDTKTDRKGVIPGKLTELKNGVFHELKQVMKRNGFLTPWSLNTVDSDTIEGGNAVYRRGKELVITGLQTRSDTGRIAWEDGRKMFSYGPDEDEWKTIGDREPLRLEVETVQRPSAQWVIPDVALADSSRYACYAWLGLKDPADSTTNRHGHATVKEIANDVNIIDDWNFGVAPIAAVDVEGVHVVGIDATNPIFYVWLAVPSTNDVYLAQINCTTLSAAGAPVVKITDLHEDMVWDVCTATHTTHGECSVVAYKDTDGFLCVRWFDEGGTLQATRTGTMVIKNACTVYEEYDRITATNKVLTAYQQDANGWIRGTTFNADDTVYAGWDYQIFGVDAQEVHNITGCKDSAADHYNWPNRSYLRLYVGVRRYYAALPAPYDSYIYQFQHEFDGTNPLQLNSMNRCCLASKAWEHESKPRVWVVHDSYGNIDWPGAGDEWNPRFQNTYFLRSPEGESEGVDGVGGRTDARCLGSEAGNESFNQSISAVVSPETNKYTFAGLRKDVLVDTVLGTSYESVVGISTTFDQYAQPSTEMGPTVQTGGGFVGDADARFQELGFHLYPEALKATVTASGSSGTPAYWWYTVTYEWTDREGQVHQSAPAIPIRVPQSGTTPNDDDHVDVQTRCLHFGDTNKLQEIRCVLYRTVNGGVTDGPFYRMPTAVHELNDPSIFFVTLEDSPGGGAFSDEIIEERPTLYTTGDIVANICPPATSIMNVRQDRVLLVPDEDRANIWFSKLKRHAVGVSFSDLFTKRVSDGGDITALATMDTREIVFKEGEIRAFSGSGPIDTGVGAFGEDYLITADVGCVDRASVVWTDKGIMFKSHKGIYLLGRNLQVSYIGAPVEDYNNFTVLKAELIEDKNQVRFLLEDNTNMLVYDYLVNQWSVFESPYFSEVVQPWGTVDSAIWQNIHVMIRDNGVVMREGVTHVDVTDTYIPLDFTTAWIKLSGLQGFQRIWWISLLGEVYGYCTLTVEISINYVDTVVQTETVTIDAAFSTDPPAQIRIKPKWQKCESIKIRVYDAEAAVPAGSQQGFSLSEIMLQIGKKPGVMRQGTTKTR